MLRLAHSADEYGTTDCSCVELGCRLPVTHLSTRTCDTHSVARTSRPTPAAQPSTSSSSKGKGKKKEVANAAGGSGATMSTSGTSGAKNEEVKRTEKMACPEGKKELNKVRLVR